MTAPTPAKPEAPAHERRVDSTIGFHRGACVCGWKDPVVRGSYTDAAKAAQAHVEEASA